MYKFPRDFVFGYSWSGFQFEMGLKGSEVPNSDWWVWVHDMENIMTGLVSGDLPENGPAYWHLYSKDHDMAEKLGMDAIRGGIEWARIFPEPTFDVRVTVERDEEGRITSVDVPESAIEELEKRANLEALEHYKRIYSDWRERGKVFILNLYHWPLPLWLHDPIKVRRFGPDRAPSGWLDDRSVVEFAKFAAFVAYHLNDFVDSWSTMNEPNVVYENGYGRPNSGFPPGYLSFEAVEKAKLNLIYAHARAYDAIKEFSEKPVGVIYAYTWLDPLSEEIAEDVRKIRENELYSFVDSVHFGESRTVGEGREELKGRVDWLGVNYYSRIAFDRVNGHVVPLPGYGFSGVRKGYAKSGRPCSDFGWEIYPEGLEKLLRELNERYGLPMMITENGMADEADRYRSYYLVSHLRAIHSAIEAGADIRGYLHWSLTDNYEWAKGFQMKFGLLKVDWESKRRYIRPSALVFKEIATQKAIPEELSHLSDLRPLLQD
ncbi:beta-galactosidase BgaS [Thermococcus celer]|uniref:Beta-galactosidase n=1 Tax=Thermococcus celer Vu 13 = JCM 8558 TaxID=1293037 RepID=A0A218P180_THECE|nr:beta-galactosidase BgaS [Thermococcus celer]ASI98663.1 beta-galactosidase [Thermococcus celer] [Thermococcus celer Vu 13 = JCM 8558]